MFTEDGNRSSYIAPSKKNWFHLGEVDDDRITFVVLVTTYKNKIIIIYNKQRNGWELPGGRREPNEELMVTAGRELFEETGAIDFGLEPYGIFSLNGYYGAAFYADVREMGELPNFEIDEIKVVDQLPLGMNFDDTYYRLMKHWDTYSNKGSNTHRFKILNNRLVKCV